ncbi:MAG: Extracellular solute-binding protein [Deltaproteobacteria bacterium]|nr:Extracellular solute-binding protein [Deltaproteobacteria bacterium]
MKRTAWKLLISATLFLFSVSAVASAAEVRPATTQEWESLVKKAEDEGEVAVYATDSIGNTQMIWAAFQKRYPKIKLVGTSVGRGSDLFPKLFSERRAGKFLADVFLAGPTAIHLNLYPAKVIEPIPPILVHPGVTDLSKWWMGKHHYVDPEGQYNFMYESALYGPPLSFNTNVINEKDIKSAWDLVQPQWKGKYAVLQMGPTQGSTAMTYVYHHPQLGPKFIEKIYRDMEPTFFRDLRQGTDWLSSGKFPLCFLCRRIDRAALQGLPVAELDPYAIAEKPGIGSGSGALVLMNRHPHPNAAKVFINWFLSLEGQIAFRQANTDEFRIGSLREDLPQEILPPLARRRKDKDYLLINRPEWMDFKPIQALLEQLKKSK